MLNATGGVSTTGKTQPPTGGWTATGVVGSIAGGAWADVEAAIADPQRAVTETSEPNTLNATMGLIWFAEE